MKRTILPQGAIKRLSVSVLIDHEVHWEGTGAKAKRVLVPPSPERLKVIHDLVAAAAGLQHRARRSVDRRKSSLRIHAESGSACSAGSPRPRPGSQKSRRLLEQFKSDPKMMMALAAIVVVVLGGGFFVVSNDETAEVRPQVRTVQALLARVRRTQVRRAAMVRGTATGDQDASGAIEFRRRRHSRAGARREWRF